jgi:hypothetical protein
MKITKENIKETLRSIMKEESEYQVFFRKALEKAGKSITDMSDDEKKAFFNKIDATWDGRGEKNEELVGNQHKLDVDGDGEIEASDLAALRAKKDESVNEGIGTIALGVAGGLLLLKVLKFVLKKVVGAIGMNAPLPKEKLLQVVQTMVKTVIAQSSGKQIDMLQLVALQSFLKDEINAGKITTVKQIIQVIERATKIAKSKQESVNEEEIKWNAVENAIINFLKANTKILDKRVKDRDTEGVKGGLKSIISGLTNAQRNLKLESVNEALLPADTKVVKSFFDKKPLEGRNLNTDGKVLKTAGIGSQEMYIHTPKGVKMVGKITGKYAQSLVQFVNKNYKTDLVESINEGRAFINAARKAKEEGKTEFEFNGKKYPVTIK